MADRSASPAPAINRREGGDRVETMRLATIRLDDGEEIPCVLRDLSPTGARLAVSNRYRLPASFHLIVHGREVAFPVRRAWQRGDYAGVMLVHHLLKHSTRKHRPSEAHETVTAAVPVEVSG